MSTPPRESPTHMLYRAALGPVQSEHHLRAFERFDARGVSGPSWNTLAALLTFNWLVYRRLWRIAAVYLLLVGAAAGALWWGRGHLPDGVTLGLAGAVVLVATALPGLFANAWLHGQLRLALVDVVRQSPSMADAADVLRQRAPSLQRLLVMCLLNLLMVALVGWQVWGSAAAQDPVAKSVVEPLATQSVVVAEPAPLPSPTQSPAPSPATAESPTPAPTAVDTVADVAPPAPPTPSTVHDPEPVAQSVSEPIAVAAARGYGINVGLFADPANARRALVRIRQAGVPARSDTLQLERGQRTRVRAGPFANRAQAEQAAARIKALGLDAQVFKQGANE
ncbi:SPOR domain-containing protein [Hydrogenophaga atypica]|uniref:SPOR domain-containing protein n=1 Tax=Hydrogenophaga atypica TaxID=249409 RepID=A0ABW2QI15_9BURK